eukprot:TRINITY_DN29147_c0_g1_i1.p1 TRINITY_DN29147_c0_g1~~TRINITY_DN29147_c0_g1_i1.p1  ORF type:complete len:1009 (+),score=152.16 TRINITY_DN29147_c0_g1_i1:242-3028(+)
MDEDGKDAELHCGPRTLLSRRRNSFQIGGGQSEGAGGNSAAIGMRPQVWKRRSAPPSVKQDECFNRSLISVSLARLRDDSVRGDPQPLEIKEEDLFANCSHIMKIATSSGSCAWSQPSGAPVRPQRPGGYGGGAQDRSMTAQADPLMLPPPTWDRQLHLEVSGQELIAYIVSEVASTGHGSDDDSCGSDDNQNTGTSGEFYKEAFRLPLVLATAWRPWMRSEMDDVFPDKNPDEVPQQSCFIEHGKQIIALASPLPDTVQQVSHFFNSVNHPNGQIATSAKRTCNLWLFCCRTVADAELLLKSMHYLGCIQSGISSKYTNAEFLGEGASGYVYRAIEKGTSKEVAIKMFTRKTSTVDLIVLHEAVALQMCKGHENVLRFEGLLFSNGQWGLVTEMLSGGELLAQLARCGGRMEESQTRDVMEQSLMAIEYIHSLEIVHRDCKLENVVLSQMNTNNVKLVDFGTAVHESDKSALCTLCGSPGYMAPEVCKKVEYNRKVDCFSAGAMVFYLLTGKLPFRGKTIAEVCDATINDAPRWKSAVCAGASSSAVSIVDALMEKNPEQRIGATTALVHPWFVPRVDAGTPTALGDLVEGGFEEGHKRACEDHGIKFEQIIGRGAASWVYSAKWYRCSEPVAVKIFASATGEMFREVAALRALRHPQLVRICALMDTDRTLALVLELCSGGNMWQFLHTKGSQIASSMTVESRLGAAIDLSHALAYIHSKKFLHRDVKSANCYLSDVPQMGAAMPAVKLGDFGFTRPHGSGCFTTMVGTPGYMAPEVIRDAKYGSGADVFSFALVLYELVLLLKPAEEKTMMTPLFLVATCNGKRPKLKDEAGVYLCDASVAELIEACWAQEASSRPSIETVRRRLLMLTNVEVHAPKCRMTPSARPRPRPRPPPPADAGDAVPAPSRQPAGSAHGQEAKGLVVTA